MKYTKDMLILKGQFIKKFAEIMVKELPDWKKTQIEYRKKLYPICVGIVFGCPLVIVAFLLALWLLFFSGPIDAFEILLMIRVILVLFLYKFAVFGSFVGVNKAYQKEIKVSYFENIVKIFGDDIYYAIGPKNYYISLNDYDKEMDLDISIPDLQTSRLFNKDVDFVLYDDKFCGIYNNILFKINEIKVSTIIAKIFYRTIFNGLALYFNLNKTVKNRVIIVSKGIYFNKENYQKVEVEYDKFAKKYDVYVEYLGSGTLAQIEARYFLNVAFLDRFMQIQTSFKVNKMQCSIYGNDMLILLSTNKDLFEMNHLLGKIDDINQYDHLFNEFASIFSFIDVLNLSSKTKL